VLNGTMVALDARVQSEDAMGPHEFFRFARVVRERLSIADGIANATMSRDEGWHFMLLVGTSNART